MTTEYDLPPLPAHWEHGLIDFVRSWGRAAIEADRKRIEALDNVVRSSRSVAQLKEALQDRSQRFTASYSEVMNLIRFYEADRKRRGEPYNYKRIGWELERTAMGDGFYGNALRVAKDIPGVSSENRSVLDRYATGTQQGTDHIVLQNIARNIYMTPQPADHSGASTLHNEDSGAQNRNQAPQSTESAKTDDICQECGGDGAGGEHEDDCSQGEPVAWWKMHGGKPSIVPASTFLAEDAIDLGWRPLGFQDSPQHAEPVKVRPETDSEHIARDMREGRFPGKSERKMVPAEPVKVPGDDEIREVLLSHGYKIKPGHDDLKPYVYAAAHELLDRYGNVSKSSEKIDTSAERVDDVDMGQHPTR